MPRNEHRAARAAAEGAHRVVAADDHARGAAARAEGRSLALRSSICCSLTTVTSLARSLTWLPSMMGEDTTTISVL